MTKWLLRCKECKNEWVLPVSFEIDKMKGLYHYCPYCKKNTFHEPVKRLED